MASTAVAVTWIARYAIIVIKSEVNTMDTHTQISVILICLSCVIIGYMIRVYSKWSQQLTALRRQIEEVDKRFEHAVMPMVLFCEKLRESGQSYSEEQFRDYLEEQGISYELWRIEAESLRARKKGE